MKNRSIVWILFVLGWFVLLSRVQAAPETALPGFNTADGDHALFSLTTGVANSAFGWYSLFSNADGNFNTGVGAGALLLNASGQGNTAVGAAALLNGTGDFNTGLGASAGINNSNGSNNIYIGDGGAIGESNVIAIGNLAASGTTYESFYTGGIFGAGVNGATAVPVYVDDGGKLGTVLMADAPGRKGAQPQAMLNKSEHRQLQQLQATVAQQQKEIAMLTAQLKEQAAQIQKVSAQVEMRKPATKVVQNNR
jgi:hypothetical protein